MDKARFRVTAIVEWAAAAAAILGTVALASLATREGRSVRAVTPVIAREAPMPLIAAPAAIPSGSVSVPILVLNNGQTFQVGDAASAVLDRLGPKAQTGAPAVERAQYGERVTRAYNYGGIRFQLVFEPFDEGAEPRLVAIYR